MTSDVRSWRDKILTTLPSAMYTEILRFQLIIGMGFEMFKLGGRVMLFCSMLSDVRFNREVFIDIKGSEYHNYHVN